MTHIGSVRACASPSALDRQLLGAIDMLPQISYWSSAPSLSDKALYPFFGRTYPSDAVVGPKMLAVIESFGWTNVGIIFVIDPYATGYVEVMQVGALTSSVNIAVTASFDVGNEAGARQAVRTIRGSGVNIIVAIVFDIDMEAILDEAHRLGMLTPAYAWLSADTLTTVTPDLSADPVRAKSLLDGFLVVTATPRLSAGFKRFSRVWSGLTPDDCSFELRTPKAALFESAPSDVAAYMYDGVTALALALDSVDEPSNSSGVLTELRKLTFEGASGRVRFVAASLDRDPVGLGFALLNAVYEPATDRFTTPVARLIEPLGLRPPNAAVPPPPIRFIGGSTVPPVDLSTQAIECADGEILSTAPSGLWVCRACEAGTFETGNHRICQPAPSDFYAARSGFSLETLQREGACPNGTLYVSLERDLVTGERRVARRTGATRATQCRCAPGTYQRTALDSSNRGGDVDGRWDCAACPPGATCAGESLAPIAEPGYAQLVVPFNVSYGEVPDYTLPRSLLFLRCINADLCLRMERSCDCPGGVHVDSITLSSTCGEGYRDGSALCSECEMPKYARIFGKCERCGDLRGLYVIGAPLGVAVIIYLIDQA